MQKIMRCAEKERGGRRGGRERERERERERDVNHTIK